eukprot:458171-Heterocapsa_arctica.AAC.1
MISPVQFTDSAEPSRAIPTWQVAARWPHRPQRLQLPLNCLPAPLALPLPLPLVVGVGAGVAFGAAGRPPGG